MAWKGAGKRKRSPEFRQESNGKKNVKISGFVVGKKKKEKKKGKKKKRKRKRAPLRLQESSRHQVFWRMGPQRI